MADRDVKPTDAFAEKLLKLLPAEVTGAYLAIRAIIDLVSGDRPFNPADPDKLPAFVIVAVIGLLTIVTPIFLSLMDLITRASQRYFLAASFFIWAINIDYSQIIKIVPYPAIARYIIPILLILWAGLALPVYLHRLTKPAVPSG